MALKFLNKKGWHTGSLRNIENVWKAEQKHDAEQKKLEELRKQIQDERERSEFRVLQEQAGLVPRQERLDFLYDSGLAVGKTSGSSSGGGVGVAFKALEESIPGTTTTNNNAPSSSSAQQSSAPGALFEDKPHSSNDAWRKLHSDPLLLIRQREQDALARVKNNPVQMAMIRKSVKASEEKEKGHDRKKHRKKDSHSKGKHHKHSSSNPQSDSEIVITEGGRRRKTSDHKHSSSKRQSDSENVRVEGEKRRKTSDSRSSKYDERHYKAQVDSDGESTERENPRGSNSYRGSKYRERSPRGFSHLKAAENDGHDAHRKNHGRSMNERYSLEGRSDLNADRKERDTKSSREARSYASAESVHHDSNYKCRKVASKLTEEERAAKLWEMQVDAELHEEQRWKRLRKAEEDDVREATRASMLGGRNFLDATHKSVYGAEKGGSSTIEESVRRRAYYSQGKSAEGDGNAFRR
ncbi:unnamed protein product [Dovyalis caffra]|uniref:CBF1-interacting co-repressor CIR N-terminal domain-containing protein n=1 Tax=Dovyalis caffra TaxID=77055 RepID=A0AAV1QSV1_9ROSI|nr:unnamed protein product [Dovyalis caffra]